jgi:hypothetical protein
MKPVDARRRAALTHLVRVGALPLRLAAPLGAWLARPAQAQLRSGSRVALVVGNAAYPGGAALRNPGNDAQAMAAQLARLGFEVVSARDATRAAMREAIARAAGLLDGRRGTGLLYYAGHGLQVGQRNFMLPVADLPTKEADVTRLAVDVGEVVEAFRRAGTKTNLVLLDACRDNPFAEAGAPRGLAPIDAPPNTFLAYATSPGNVAEDGAATDANGLYTGFLLKELQRPGARIEDVFKRVRLGVRQASQGRQVPWESTSLEEDFFFDPTPPAPAPPREAEALALAEKATWERMSANARAEDLFAFLLVFPQGQFTERALFLLNLRQTVALAAVTAPPSAAPPQVTNQVPPPAPAPVPRQSDGYGSDYGSPPPRPAPTPAPTAAARPAGPAAPLVFSYRGERFRVGDACEWVVRDFTTGRERGRSAIQVSSLADMNVRYDTEKPAGIARDAMGARLRDGFATYEDPVIDLPAEYAVGARWSGNARMRLHQGGQGVLDYSARVVGRQAIIVGGQAFEAWVVEARGSAKLQPNDTSSYASRLWALPQFGIPLRHEVRLRPRGSEGQVPAQDEIVECLWVRLAR